MTCPRVISAVLLTAYVTSAVTVFEECRREEYSWAGYHIKILASAEQTATERFSIRE